MAGLGLDLSDFDELFEHELYAVYVGFVAGAVGELLFNAFSGSFADHLIEWWFSCFSCRFVVRSTMFR